MADTPFAPSEARSPDLVVVRAVPFNAETPLAALRLPLTPTELHYVRSNFPVPSPDGQLVIQGTVAHPRTWSVAELQAMPATTLTVTLECAGNGRTGMAPLPSGEPWATGAVGTARWTGVPLRTLLLETAPLTDAVAVIFQGADHGPYKGEPDVRFERALPLDGAMAEADGPVVAYAMNAEPLTPDHGAPLRLIVPAWYGMASVKWLTAIEVSPAPFAGQFQTQSYVYHAADGSQEPVTRQRVRALITDPVPGDLLPAGQIIIQGKAWSGNGAVTVVEVSIDAGEWQPAILDEPTDAFGWQAWSCVWVAPTAGRHTIRARATDATGQVQPDVPEWNRLGYGNNAVTAILVDVV